MSDYYRDRKYRDRYRGDTFFNQLGEQETGPPVALIAWLFIIFAVMVIAGVFTMTGLLVDLGQFVGPPEYLDPAR